MSAVQNVAVPPHSLEAERSVLGAVLLDERHLFPLLVEEHLRPDHFFRDQHGAVFAAMLELHENNRKIDQLTVAETLRQQGKLEEVGGPEAIDGLAGWVPAAGTQPASSSIASAPPTSSSLPFCFSVSATVRWSILWSPSYSDSIAANTAPYCSR